MYKIIFSPKDKTDRQIIKDHGGVFERESGDWVAYYTSNSDPAYHRLHLIKEMFVKIILVDYVRVYALYQDRIVDIPKDGSIVIYENSQKKSKEELKSILEKEEKDFEQFYNLGTL